MPHLSIELGDHLEVMFQIGSEHGLYNEEPESFKLALLELTEPVVAGVRQEQLPGGGRVVRLEHRPVVVQHGLKRAAHNVSL